MLVLVVECSVAVYVVGRRRHGAGFCCVLCVIVARVVLWLLLG